MRAVMLSQIPCWLLSRVSLEATHLYTDGPSVLQEGVAWDKGGTIEGDRAIHPAPTVSPRTPCWHLWSYSRGGYILSPLPSGPGC